MDNILDEILQIANGGYDISKVQAWVKPYRERHDNRDMHLKDMVEQIKRDGIVLHSSMKIEPIKVLFTNGCAIDIGDNYVTLKTVYSLPDTKLVFSNGVAGFDIPAKYIKDVRVEHNNWNTRGQKEVEDAVLKYDNLSPTEIKARMVTELYRPLRRWGNRDRQEVIDGHFYAPSRLGASYFRNVVKLLWPQVNPMANGRPKTLDTLVDELNRDTPEPRDFGIKDLAILANIWKQLMEGGNATAIMGVQLTAFKGYKVDELVAWIKENGGIIDGKVGMRKNFNKVV